jgi:O-antigen/teichoic acid export membrane protein
MTGVFATTTAVTLYGDRYATSGAVLMVLSVGYYFSMALGYNVYVLQVYGRLRYLVLSNLAVVVCFVPLAIWLIREHGAVGAGIATAATMAAQNIANQVVLMVTMRNRGVVRTSYVAPYLVIVAVAVLLGAVNLVFQPGIFAALAVSSLAALLVLRLTRRWLNLAETFPELLRVPLLGRLVR